MSVPFDTETEHDQPGRHPGASTVEDLRRNLATVQARVDTACYRAGHYPATVRLRPVSKTKLTEGYLPKANCFSAP